MDKGTEIKLAEIKKKQRKLEREKLQLLKANSDPEKKKRLFAVGERLYLQILDTNVTDDLNLRSFIESVMKSLSADDIEFFNTHKHDQFYQGKKLFEQYDNHDFQKLLKKKSYIGILGIKKQKTLCQLIKFVAGAKVQHYRDSLINELKALREKEALRYTLFERDGFKQITDFNERECLLELKSYPELTDKVLMEKLNVPRSNWYRYKKKFQKLELL